MSYFVLRKDKSFDFYSNLTKLIETENLNKSRSYFSKHFWKNDYYADGDIQIWRNRDRGQKGN